MPVNTSSSPFIPASLLLEDIGVWPSDLVEADGGASILDRIGIRDVGITDTEKQTTARFTVVFQDELLFSLPGLSVIALVFGGNGVSSEFPIEVDLREPAQLRFVDVSIALRFSDSILKPVRENDGRFEIDLSRRYVEIEVSGSIIVDGDGIRIEGMNQLSLPPCMISNSGIVIEASSVVLDLSTESTIPQAGGAGLPQSWRGVFMEEAAIHLPPELGSAVPSALSFQNCFIGSGGFTGQIEADWNPGFAGSIGGVPFALLKFALEFRQNSFVRSEVQGRLTLPFFEEPVEVDIGLDLSGGLSVKLTSASANGLYKLTKKDILELELDSIGFELKNGVFIAKLSGQLTPLAGEIKWPSFDVKELSIDSKGHVHMDGGWVSLPKSYSLDFHGVAKVAITKFGLGHTEDGRKYIGLSGHVELVKKAPAGASVEGLRIIWDDQGHIALTFEGIGVKFSVPGAIEFDGKVSYKKDNTTHKFTGDLTLKLPKLNNLTLIAKAVFGTTADASGKPYKYFAIYIEGNFGTGIPLFSTGLSLTGLAGLFAINYAPDKPPEMMWYSIDKSKSWFHKPQTGVTDLVSKWRPEEGTLAVGLGVTLGTSADNGHEFSGKFLLLMLFPGPVLMIEGRAAFLGKPSDLSGDVEPPFHTLIVLDNRAGYFLIGLDAQWKNDKVKGGLLEIHGSAEAYFNFHDPTQWHIWLGKRDPVDQRIQASFAHSFTANCYFMLDPKQLALGAWVGKNAHYGWGPVSADLQASMEANAVVSFKPAHLSAGVSLDGSLAVKVFRFKFALGLHASLAAEVSEPFHIKGVVQITIQTKVKNFDIEVSFEWGPRIEAPDLTVPELKPILNWGVAHPKASLEWPLEGGGAPLVPMDCRPYVTFGYAMDDAISVGVNTGPSPGWMIIGDKSTGKSVAQVRYRLTQLSLYQHDQLDPQEKLIAARPKPAGHPDTGDIYGSWAPAAVSGGGTGGQNKLLLWEKNPLALTDNTASWNPWLASNLPNYPCPSSDSETICVDFQRFSPGKQLYGPWRSGQHLDFVVSWADSLTHPIVPVSPAAEKRDRGLSFPAPSSRKRYRAYVSNGDDNTISLLDLETRTVLASIPVGLYPRQVVLSPDGKRAFACHQNDNTVIAIDTATNQRIGAPIAVIQSPVSIAITPDGSKAFVPSGTQPVMSVINPVTLQVIATVKLLGVANRAVVSPDGKKLYVMHGPNHAVSVISTDSLAVTKVVAAPSGPGSMAIHPTLPSAWVTIPDRGVVRLFDTSRNEFAALETPTGKFARDMAISPDGARLFVGNLQQNTVSVLDTLTLDIVADIPVRSGPQGLEMTPDGSSLLVANYFDNSVTIIDPFKNQVVAEGIQAGKGSDSFAVIEAPSQMAYRAFVSNQFGNAVAVLDLQTGKTLASITVGKTPRMVAITPDQKRVCVCNADDASLTIIDAVTYSVVGSPVPVVKEPISIAISPDGKRAFVGSAEPTMSIIDLVSLETLTTITLPGPADSIVLSTDGNRAYVMHWPVHAVSVFSINPFAMLQISAPGAPQDMVLHPSLPLGYASFPDEGSVRVFDTATGEFTSIEVKTGKWAQDLCMSPDGSRLYVANLNENTVSVIETATNRVIDSISVPGPKSPVFTSDGLMLVVASYTGSNVTLIDPSTNRVLGTPIRSDGFNNSVVLAGTQKESSLLSPVPFEVTIDVPRGSSSVEVTWSGKGPLHGSVSSPSVAQTGTTVTVGELPAPARDGNPNIEGVILGTVSRASAPQNEITAIAGSLLIFSAASFGLGKQGIDQIRLRSDSEWTLISVCITKPAMEGGLAELTRVEEALNQQIDLWYKPAPLLEPEKDYRLVVEVSGEAVGMGELNGWSASLSGTREIRFHTVLPPGLGNVDHQPNQATGLEDLSLYIDRTIPVTQIAKNELPALRKPVFRGYDVTVEFNESYVDQMYQLANRDLDLLFFDRNNEAVRDASGALIIVEDPWANAPEIQLTETQALWISMSSNCADSVIDPKLIPTNKLLRAADAHVLESDTVYEARLVPRLMRQSNVSGPRWTAMPGADGAALLVLIPPSSSGPDAWTDYRVSVLVLIGSSDQIGIPFRFANGNYYEFVIDPSSNTRRLTLVQGAQTALLKEDSYGYHPGKDAPFRIHIEAIGPNLLVTQNGEIVFSLSDTRLVAGGAGVRQPASQTTFTDFGLSDLRAGAPVAFRFDFTTSNFASFYHQIHSYQDEVWRVALDPASGGANLAAKAVPPSQPVSDAESRDYAELASLVLGSASLQDPAQIEITRVEAGGVILGWLLLGSEPIDWNRTEITAASTVPRAVARGVPPREVKITDAEFGDSESVIVLAREQVDLSGHTIQYLRMPAAIADETSSQELWKAGQPLAASVPDGTVAGDASWTDYRASVVCSSSRPGGIGLRFRYVDEKNHYLFTYDFVSGQQQVVKTVDGAAMVIKEATGDAAPGQRVRLTVSVRGPLITAYRVNQKVIEVSDSALLSGGVAVASVGNATARFDSLEVRRLPNETYSLFHGQFSSDAITDWQKASDASGLNLKAIGSVSWTDTLLRARVRRITPGTMGLLLRYQDPNNYYRLLFTDDERRLECVVNGASNPLWTAAAPPAIGRLFEIEVSLDGNVLRVFQDSVLACEVTDNTFAFGSVGLCASEGAAFAVQLVVYPATMAFSGWSFQDDFHAVSAQGWRFVDEGDTNGPSLWQIKDGRLTQTSAISDSGPDPIRKRGTVALVDQSNLTSFRLVTRLRSQQGNAIGVVFGYQDPGSFYRFSLDANAGYRRLLRSVNGTVKVLWEDSVPYEAGRDYAVTVDVIDECVRGWLDGELLFNIVELEEIKGSAGLYCCANPDASFGEFRLGAPFWVPYYTFGRELPLPAGNRIKITSASGGIAPNARTSIRFAADLDDPAFYHLPPNGTQLRSLGPDAIVRHLKEWIPSEDYTQLSFQVLRKPDGTGIFLVPDSPMTGGATVRLFFRYQRNKTGSVRFSEVGDDRDEHVFIDLPPGEITV